MTGCDGGPSLTLQVVIAVLAALNVALGTWLAHRRSQADLRERKRNGDDSKPSCKHRRSQRDIDSGRVAPD